MSRQTLRIRPLVLKWWPWKPWDSVKKHVRLGGERVPHKPGVYEVKARGQSTGRQYIGMASSLRMRVKQGLVKGKVPHAGYKKMHKQATNLLIRWAETPRPATAEEDLLVRYQRKHGRRPTFNKHAPKLDS